MQKWLIGSGCLWGCEWGWSKDRCIRWGPIAPRGRRRFGEELMSVCYYGICHCVADKEMCSVCMRKFEDFCLANVSLEMSVPWLSDVSFEIKVGVYEKFAKT